MRRHYFNFFLLFISFCFCIISLHLELIYNSLRRDQLLRSDFKFDRFQQPSIYSTSPDSSTDTSIQRSLSAILTSSKPLSNCNTTMKLFISRFSGLSQHDPNRSHIDLDVYGRGQINTNVRKRIFGMFRRSPRHLENIAQQSSNQRSSQEMSAMGIEQFESSQMYEGSVGNSAELASNGSKSKTSYDLDNSAISSLNSQNHSSSRLGTWGSVKSLQLPWEGFSTVELDLEGKNTSCDSGSQSKIDLDGVILRGEELEKENLSTGQSLSVDPTKGHVKRLVTHFESLNNPKKSLDEAGKESRVKELISYFESRFGGSKVEGINHYSTMHETKNANNEENNEYLKDKSHFLVFKPDDVHIASEDSEKEISFSTPTPSPSNQVEHTIGTPTDSFNPLLSHARKISREALVLSSSGEKIPWHVINHFPACQSNCNPTSRLNTSSEKEEYPSVDRWFRRFGWFYSDSSNETSTETPSNTQSYFSYLDSDSDLPTPPIKNMINRCKAVMQSAKTLFHL